MNRKIEFDKLLPHSRRVDDRRWEPPSPNLRRRSLLDLAPTAHCSIIGTCLSLGELRKVVIRIAGNAVRHLSDYDIHTLGVRYAATAGPPSKLLNKALDEKHSVTIKCLQKAGSEEELRSAWAQALKEGNIEGPYWGICTHPRASEAFFGEVFGEVHMLSHLVGSANRADVRRLAQLDAERDELLAEIAQLRRQVSEGWSRRDRELRELRDLLVLGPRRSSDKAGELDDSRAATLERVAAELRQRLEHEIKRAQKHEASLRTERKAADDLRRELSRAKNEVATLSQEVDELERLHGAEQGTITDLKGRLVLLVGGPAKGVKSIRAVIENLGASFLHHDGGKEQAVILLRGLVSRADIVLVPVDCVSHDAALQCKRFASNAGKPFVPLAHAGVGSVLRALRELRL